MRECTPDPELVLLSHYRDGSANEHSGVSGPSLEVVATVICESLQKLVVAG